MEQILYLLISFLMGKVIWLPLLISPRYFLLDIVSELDTLF